MILSLPRNVTPWLCALLLCLTLHLHAQTLNLNNGILTYATLANTTVTMTGRAELRLEIPRIPLLAAPFI